MTVSDNSNSFFKTSEITENTKIEIQYRTFRCIRTIKNILVTAFAISVTAAVIALMMTVK